MKNFEYAAPKREADVVSLLSADRGETEILAGGTDLMPLRQSIQFFTEQPRPFRPRR